MNNYKFRGKTASNWPGEWVYGFLVKDCSQSYIYNGDNGDFSDCGGVPIEDLHGVRPETVGQWTGRLDKNGKEIYADDFIKYPTAYNCPDPYFVGRIVFEGGAWKIENSNPLYDYYERSVEICGNKFDNPELQEEK